MARTPTRRTPEQDAYLAQVAEAARRRDAAESDYRAAILAAYEDGRVTQAAIAQTLGLTPESVRRYLERHGATA